VVAASSAQGSNIRVTPESSSSELLEGERKTVTALFADIKGSTELMEDLDPEEARAIVDPALKLMIDAAHRYDGYVVQSTGDGIFALFGAPVAHEDHPQRALYAALRLQEELKRYSAKVLAEGGTPIQGRVGINTGEVVVRSIQTGAGQVEYTPIGHTTNLASRMQTAAPVGSIAVSEATRKLCEGYFILKSLGATKVKGVSEPVNVYEVTGLGPLRTRLQRAAGRGLTKFVGREREMEALKYAAERAKAGHGQIVAAMAEPGVGKSRLFFEFKATSQSSWMVLETFSVSHGKASAYLPVIDLLRNYFDISAADDERKRREKVTGRVLAPDRGLEDTLPYLFSLLGIVEGEDPSAQMDGQIKKRRTLEAIKRIVLRESLNQPLMVIFEDLHWIDEATQELLNLLADSIGTAQILLLVNYRPEYSHQWNSKTYYTQLRLDPLGKASAEEMLSALLGASPAPATQSPGASWERPAGDLQVAGRVRAPDSIEGLKRLIIEKTEGNPFFMEETVQVLFDEAALVSNGLVKLTRPLAELKIPPTVQGILAARIDRLPSDAKDLLQALSVIGREFPLSLIRAVVTKSDDELNRLLNDLQLAEFIYEQPAVGDAQYIFKHALTQEVAYSSVLNERRKLLHERIGAALESLHRGRPEDHLDHLAHHFQRSDNAAKAVEYLRLAGEQSARRSSPREAIAYLREALDRTKALPADDERDRAELAVQFALGSVLTAESFGAPEKVRAFERVSELAARTGAGAEIFPALWHFAAAYISREKLARANELARQSLRLAEAANDRHMLLGAHHIVGESVFWTGNFREAGPHILLATELYDRAADKDLTLYYGMDPFVLSCVMLAWVENSMGRCDRALNLCRDARARATQLSHLYSIAFSLMGMACMHQMRREAGHAETAARDLSTMCREHGFTEMLGWGEWVRGWAMLEQRPAQPGLEIMAEAMDLHDSIGGTPGTPMRRGVLAECYAKNGRLDDAGAELRRAVEAADQTGQHFFDAELCRIGGEIALRSDPREQKAAERYFRNAISVANQQEARSWELRATTSLARLLAKQGHREEARTMLAAIYNWFTEGFDTADLKDAKALLNELSTV